MNKYAFYSLAVVALVGGAIYLYTADKAARAVAAPGNALVEGVSTVYNDVKTAIGL